MNLELELALRLGVAAVVGLAIGMEREWSGHASGPSARFAGARTFALLGTLGGLGGTLVAQGFSALGVVLLAGIGALAVAAYVLGVLRTDDIDGTTEAAALLVAGVGALAGLGHLAVASGTGTVAVLVLAEKTRIHGFAQRIGQQEMQAALYFAVFALVILPLLPRGPFGPLGGVSPRSLWLVVLVFCALNFAGYLARRWAGEERGYALTGLLGGLISSTAVTLSFSRKSRTDEHLSPSLAIGVVAACTVLVPRLLTVTLVFNPLLAARVGLYLLPPLLVGVALVAARLRRVVPTADPNRDIPAENPLGFWSALRMALAFQVVLFAVSFAREQFGTPGILTSAALLGLTDMDALTYSMIQLAAGGGALYVAAEAIAIGVLSNTVLKLALTLVLGSAAFRRRASTGVGLLGLGSLLGLWLGLR